MQHYTHNQAPAGNTSAGAKKPWIERLVEWYVHDWQGIPRHVDGPLSAPRVEKPKTKEVPKAKEGSTAYIENAATNTWGFFVAGPATGGRNAQLTEYDAYLLDQRGYKNHLLNTNAKQFWAAGATASEAAKLLGKSTDYLKKLWGTFSAALETENQVQKGAKP